MTPQELRKRVFVFAIQVVKFCRTLPRTDEVSKISSQLCDAALSSSANYRAAGRGRSKKEFVAKLGIVVEESDEVVHWLSVLDALEHGDSKTRAAHLQEGGELLAIFAASYNTARGENRFKPDKGRLPKRPLRNEGRDDPMTRSPDHPMTR